jgi:hypothetical protein
MNTYTAWWGWYICRGDEQVIKFKISQTSINLKIKVETSVSIFNDSVVRIKKVFNSNLLLS